jgi:hypothetical protein
MVVMLWSPRLHLMLVEKGCNEAGWAWLYFDVDGDLMHATGDA